MRTYRRNIGNHVLELNLGEVDSAKFEVSRYEADIIVGGPPCQDFSTAVKRKEGERADLTVAFARIVSSCNPQFFLMENVPQVSLSSSYQKLRQILAPNGFNFKELVLDSSVCGVLQFRKRYFAFGWRGNLEKKGERFARWIDEHKQAIN